MNDDDLRDCFAMFAMVGIIVAYRGEDSESTSQTAYEYADAMLEARKAKDETGIAAVKRTRKAK